MKKVTSPLHSPTEEQQDKLIDDAHSVVKVQSFHMKCCLDKGKLMEALKHASNMLGELRTSLLSPKAYYELYMAVMDELGHLERYLCDEFERGRRMADLYELVQYAGNIIPRLYLLVTVGLVYMKTTVGCRRDVLRDLVEMCRGVQHPHRGLFLRNYLLTCCKNVLPDCVNELPSRPEGDTEDNHSGSVTDGKEDHSGTVEDSIDFILVNFAEMNKLWVRMQHQGHSSQRVSRERERMDLRILVGTNLVRLSQLDCVDELRYKNQVLPGILEQVVSCRDAIAQEYLMECIIQVFPDEFHLNNLQPFLNSCAQLVPHVNVKNIINCLIDRLAATKDIPLPDDLFDIFSQQIDNMIKSRDQLPIEDVICMNGSLINFSNKKITDQVKREECMNKVLGNVLYAIKDKRNTEADHIVLMNLLKIPIVVPPSSPSGMVAIKTSLILTNYKHLLKEACNPRVYKTMSILILNSAWDTVQEERVDESLRLSQEEIITFLTYMCDPLINGPKVEDGEQDDEDFIDEQVLLGKFLHYLMSPLCIDPTDLDTHYLIVSSARKILAQGGPHRIRYTFPSLVFQSLALAIRFSGRRNEDEKWEKKCSQIFKFVHQTITAIMKDSGCPDLCLRLFLESAVTAFQTGISNRETMAYEFISQAFSIYEEDINDSKQQLASLILIISTIKQIPFETAETLDPLRNQCYLNGSKLVKKSDQCRAILSASMLFVHHEAPSPDKGYRAITSIESEAIKCIKKCVKISSNILDSEVQVHLLVEILSHLTLLIHCDNQEVKDIAKSFVHQIEDKKRETPLSDLIATQYVNTLRVMQKELGDDLLVPGKGTPAIVNGSSGTKSRNTLDDGDEDIFTN